MGDVDPQGLQFLLVVVLAIAGLLIVYYGVRVEKQTPSVKKDPDEERRKPCPYSGDLRYSRGVWWASCRAIGEQCTALNKLGDNDCAGWPACQNYRLGQLAERQKVAASAAVNSAEASAGSAPARR